MSGGIRVASVSEIPEGTGKTFQVRGKQIAVFHLEDGFHALENVCPECGSHLERSTVTETAVSCPYHGWEIDIVEGICPINPEHQRETYPVRVENDAVWVEVG
jgi:nitrite reductase/ring-hydroxylating ferredoxin subunit